MSRSHAMGSIVVRLLNSVGGIVGYVERRVVVGLARCEGHIEYYCSNLVSSSSLLHPSFFLFVSLSPSFILLPLPPSSFSGCGASLPGAGREGSRGVGCGGGGPHIPRHAALIVRGRNGGLRGISQGESVLNWPAYSNVCVCLHNLQPPPPPYVYPASYLNP